MFIYVYFNDITPKLGLDLQGGISLILTAEEGTDSELIEQAVNIMRSRIAAFGDVQEPEISISGENSVLVQLPGITDQEKAIEAVGTTGLLTFRPVLDSSLSIGYSPALEIIENPDDPENQAYIHEQVRLQNVQANMETAMEELPEGFGRVCMLYVNVEINGEFIFQCSKIFVLSFK